MGDNCPFDSVFALAGTVFFLLSRQVFIGRYFVIDIDLCLFGAAAIFLPGWLRGITASALFGIALLDIVSQCYYFEPSAFLQAAGFLPLMRLSAFSWYQISIFAAAIVLVALYGWLAVWIGSVSRIPALACCLLVLLAAEMLDIRDGYSTMLSIHSDNALISQKLSGSFASRVFDGWPQLHTAAGGGALTAIPIASASRVLGEPEAHALPNVVLIIVESWGALKDPSAQTALVAPLMGLNNRYDITIGFAPYTGGTTRGELRELCNLDLDYRLIGDVQGLDCLPARYAAKGYKVTAIHGFAGSMFDREKWWPRVGLKNPIFAPELFHMGYRSRCGSVFNGICDRQIAQLIGNVLSTDRTRPQFIYWLTINTHLPVPLDMAARAPFPCDLIRGGTANACRHAGLLRQLLSEVATVAAKPGLPPTEFLLVGDHAPPFALRKSRDVFLTGEVPYIHMTPHVWQSPQPKMNGSVSQTLLPRGSGP